MPDELQHACRNSAGRRDQRLRLRLQTARHLPEVIDDRGVGGEAEAQVAGGGDHRYPQRVVATDLGQRVHRLDRRPEDADRPPWARNVGDAQRKAPGARLEPLEKPLEL